MVSMSGARGCSRSSSNCELDEMTKRAGCARTGQRSHLGELNAQGHGVRRVRFAEPPRLQECRVIQFQASSAIASHHHHHQQHTLCIICPFLACMCAAIMLSAPNAELWKCAAAAVRWSAASSVFPCASNIAAVSAQTCAWSSTVALLSCLQARSVSSCSACEVDGAIFGCGGGGGGGHC
jgi:hypothetical protein